MELRKIKATAYHPQGYGLIECFNQMLMNTLSETVDKSKKLWDDLLPFVLFVYHTGVKDCT